ncbi:CDP-diacylglycerol--serine O-phosphatidyltransferase [Amphibiibacter pelophylacis]|uniref:CDP-diacylglycerol--serine O-phosphatidyltransferase n=1 Tax=Amphibiibacter pelophylacis TaxID=1799477 RepID=A0ACC6NYQ9_9BURK
MTGQTNPDQDGAAAQPPVRARRKGVYILPNLFTLAALFGGFYAIIMSMHGLYDKAVTGIICAMVLDALDGRVARLTHTQSAFGEQMDSLSDMVSFGVAPAVMIYTWGLSGMGRLGWLVAFMYCACAALRLARFNVNTGVVDKRYFQGLPSPAAAALIAGFVWILQDYGIRVQRTDTVLPVVTMVLTLYAGLTMVTNVPFYSFKDLSARRSVPVVVLVLVAFLLALIIYEPPSVLFIFFMAYAVSGYVLFGYRLYRGERVSLVSTSTNEPEERDLHH